MAAFIRSVLAQVKSEVARVLAPHLIQGICPDLNCARRNRTLDPLIAVYSFQRQILESNTACD
jgi:hypothetical protein